MVKKLKKSDFNALEMNFDSQKEIFFDSFLNTV